MAERPARLTPKIRELVASDRQGRPLAGRLTVAHVDVLAGIATGRLVFTEPVSSYRAIRTLAVAARPEISVPVLAQVLADRRAPTTDRVVAARELGHIATSDAESVLVRRVSDREPLVQQAVFSALGMCGGPSSLRKLARVTEPEGAAAQRQLVFARVLIVHRHGLDGPFLPETDTSGTRPGDPDDHLRVTFRARTAKATAADRARFVGSTYGIRFTERAFSLRCGRVERTVFLNADVGGSMSLDNLFDRPWIAAVVARWYLERKAASAQYLLLTRPLGSIVRLDVVRTDGEVMYAGSVDRRGAGLAFVIADVDRPGTVPTDLSGR